MPQIKLFTLLCTLLFINPAPQSRFYTRTGNVAFICKGSLGKVEGTNSTTLAVLDSKSGAMEFVLQVKSFSFQKQLMQQHFNEEYVESDKFPEAEFKGSITNNSEINYTQQGSYVCRAKGKLTIHGVTKDIDVPATIKITDGKINAISTFTILLSDYDIKIPSLVKDQVSNVVTITVNCDLELLKN
jgi:polyisoprenoid-binding protein YceI